MRRDTDTAFAKYAHYDLSIYPEWFQNKICDCDHFHYQPGWDISLSEFKIIPTCRNCDKWANRMMVCCRCKLWFYHFFSHPAVGYHTTPRRGWYCWNCCIQAWPNAVEKRSQPREIIPPPLSVIPPGQMIMEYP